jgi:hypothetical protein
MIFLGFALMGFAAILLIVFLLGKYYAIGICEDAKQIYDSATSSCVVDPRTLATATITDWVNWPVVLVGVAFLVGAYLSFAFRENSKTARELRKLQMQERTRLFRTALFCAGLITLLFSIGSAGFTGFGNPKSWSSAFSAMNAAGEMRWLAVPLFVTALVLFACALVAHFFERLLLANEKL